METLVKDFLSRERFAVAGSFRNESKFAYRILVDLSRRGHTVIPVNPRVSEVDGKICYKTVSDIPGGVDVVSIVTPPSATKEILRQCLQKGIKRAWLQPGAEDPEAIEFCRANGIKVIHGVCVMLKL